MKSVSLTKAVLNTFDLVLLATDHDGFDYGLIEKESKLIVDTRGKFNVSKKVIKA
jgi:UDP-N-acetyl-D-glucosamine dehydrogenase